MRGSSAGHPERSSDEEKELERVVAWSLARTHLDPEGTRRFVRGRLVEALQPTLRDLAEEVRPLVGREDAAGEVLRIFAHALDQAVYRIWDAIATVHPGLEALWPLVSSLERMPQPVHRNLAGAMARCLEESSEPLRGAFLARALNALARLAPQLEERELGEAAAAPSDYAVLVSALGKPEAIAVVQQDDPLAEARVRGLEMRERLLRAEGGALTSELVGRRLGITRQAVDKRRRAGRLLAFSTGRRGYVYPLWQFGPEGVLPGFGLVLADLAVCDPWMQAAFFLSGDARLGGMTPLEALRKGEVDDVRRAARGYGEHSAV